MFIEWVFIAMHIPKTKALSTCFSSFIKENNIKNGFLPSHVPGISLPDTLSLYSEHIVLLPNYFSVGCDGVRTWLDNVFFNYNSSLNQVIDNLTIEEKYELFTILSILIQSYRWDRCPPEAKEYNKDHITFPKGLYCPWKKLCQLFSLPLSNTYYAVIASNWTLKDKQPGDLYTLTDIRIDNIKLLYPWLKSPHEEQLTHFLLSFVELEAFGSYVIDCITKAFEAIEQHNVELLKHSLSELDVTLNRFNKAFGQRIRPQNILIKDWKEVIHIPFGWGLLQDGEKLEGASGMQVGTLAMLNSFFGIASESSIGQATLNSRVYLLPKQRHLLSILDDTNVLQAFVKEVKNSELTALYNKNLESLTRWRVSHQKRGHKYLAHATNGTPQMATGLTLPDSGGGIEDVFYEDMQKRIKETREAKIL